MGTGWEMVVTLGTGMGSALFSEGQLAPHLELAHHPFRKGDTYEEQLGNDALEQIGPKKWNRRVELAVTTLRTLTTFDRLYIGGGQREAGRFQAVRTTWRSSTTRTGSRAGAWLWRQTVQPA